MPNLTIQDLRKISDEIALKKIANIKECIQKALDILNRKDYDTESVKIILQDILQHID